MAKVARLFFGVFSKHSPNFVCTNSSHGATNTTKIVSLWTGVKLSLIWQQQLHMVMTRCQVFTVPCRWGSTCEATSGSVERGGPLKIKPEDGWLMAWREKLLDFCWYLLLVSDGMRWLMVFGDFFNLFLCIWFEIMFFVSPAVWYFADQILKWWFMRKHTACMLPAFFGFRGYSSVEFNIPRLRWTSMEAEKKQEHGRRLPEDTQFDVYRCSD